MKFLNNRVLPFVCALLILISLCIVPVYASSGVGYDSGLDNDSVISWQAAVSNPVSDFIDAFSGFLSVPNTSADVFWRVMDSAIGNQLGEVDYSQLEIICKRLNNAFGSNPINQQYSGLPDTMARFFGKTLNELFNFGTVHFEIVYPSSTAGFYRIQETISGLYVVNSKGRYPCSEYVADSSESDSLPSGSTWVPISFLNGKMEMLAYETLFNLAQEFDLTPIRYGEYWVIKKPSDTSVQFILGNSNQYPYVALYDDDKWAVNQDRPQTSVTDGVDEIVEGILEGITPGIDLSNMTVTLPDGRVNFIDNLIYDESTKTYTVDSHDTYMTENNFYLEWNYEWNYYINFTSITYIGQTEEYNKYYEVYYELPDGRDSADLSKEDLEQLNLSIDVIPYGRSADDTSLRSLYHFDGDTKDSSYWNYCTDFTWNKGASLTYMEAGAFEGALYLDETEHDFTIQLPSSIGTGDFTIQFRYYQSHTLAPVTDSYVKFFDGVNLLRFNGSSFMNEGTTICSTSIGTWNELAVTRTNGTVYWYVNGVCYLSESTLGSTYFGDQLVFHFGSDQQTYKYFDELRVLNYAIAAGDNYTPTSVPHDTNLTLVLPDSAVPIADEYWSITSSGDNLFQYDMDDGKSKGFAGIYTTQTIGSTYGGSSSSFIMYALDEGSTAFAFPTWGINQTYLSSSVSSDCVIFTSSRNSLVEYNTVHSANGSFISQVGYWVGTALSTLISYNSAGYLANGAYVLSVVLEDGTISSYPFTMSNGRPTSSNVLTFDWGTIGIAYCASRYGSGADRTPSYYLYIQPNVNEPVSIRHIELIQGTETDLKAEFVSSIVGIDRDSLNTPTLAVRTDEEITSHIIGGPRPSLPEKGMVWALVENERITSLQVYNGQAWEAVDGRIWTGERWVPYNAYNIITLQDMYDIVDATPDFEYIYSESGFWTWWQKSWNAFQERLFKALGSGSGGTSIVPGTVKESVSKALSSLIEGIFGTITEVLKSLIQAAGDLLSGLFSFLTDTVLGGVKDFFSSLGELVNPFESSIENEDGTTTTTTELPEGISTVFAFFSGLFMIMPEELRLIMMFGIGLMLLLAVFKLARA